MEDMDRNTKNMILKGIASLKSEACFDEARLGHYLEGQIYSEETSNVEGHLETCLYCINRLTEIRELIFLERSGKPFTAEQVNQFTRPLFKKKQDSEYREPRRPVYSWSFQKLLGPLSYPSMNWKYAAGLSVMMILFLGSMLATIKVTNPDFLSSGSGAILTAEAETNIRKSGVKVDLLDPSGKNIQTIPGIVIDSQGLILTNLKDLKKADSARVNLSDGTSFPVIGVQVDNERNLAVLKVSQKNLVPVKLSRPKTLQVGDKFIHILDPTDPVPTANHVVITQVSVSNPNGGKTHQNFEISGQKPISSKGILVNPDGETVGRITGGEGMVGSAVTFEFNESFTPSENFIPISLIGK